MRIVRRYSWWRQLVRLLRFRLIVPLLRSQHPPEHTARGVMIGMAWALTPTVGLQMYGVLVTWLVARRLFNWDFNLVIGAGWTWTTNVLTMLPCYYAFYVTGQLILGHVDDIFGYASFVGAWEQAFDGEVGLWEGLVAYAAIMARDWGLAMLVGSIPWAIGGGWLGYVLGLRFARASRARRMARRRVVVVAA
jgi:uncharacterized protein (DUF2062 family)